MKAKEAIIEEFKNYVSPSKVAVYKQMGIELVPGRREGPYIWDLDSQIQTPEEVLSGFRAASNHRARSERARDPHQGSHL